MRFYGVVFSVWSAQPESGSVYFIGFCEVVMLLRCLLVLFILVSAVPAVGQTSERGTETPRTGPKAATSPVTGEKVSDAERITRLRTAIEQNEKLVAELKARIEDPESEYAKAEEEFKKLDEQLQAKKREVQQLRDSASAEQASAVEKQMEALQKQWQLAKDRFDLAIQERRTLQDQLATVQQKIEQDKAALNKLLAPPAPVQPEAAPPTTAPGLEDKTAGEPSSAERSPEAKPDTKPAPPATPPGTVVPGIATPPSEETAAPVKEKPEDKQLTKAKEEAAAKQAEAQEAEQEFRSIEERITTLQKTIESEKKLRDTARKMAANARQTERTLSEQVQKLVADGGSHEQIQQMLTSVSEARQRLRSAQDEVQQRADRIDQLRDDLAKLQAERITALEQVEAKREAAKQAEKQVARIENPFSPQNLLKWVIEHGPRLVFIVVGALLLLALVRLLDKRLVTLIAGRTDRGSRVERENRAQTLVSVFNNAANLVIVLGALFMIIAEFQINITPLIGGAAVVGLAVAFGAQNLIRDFFTGFIILLENQYGVNDVVKIGDNAGLVERITLRLTVLRDLEGVVHFIPNGEVKTVRNMTHGWSRALFEIGVAYKESVDEVMRVLMGLARDLCNDPEYRDRILAEPEMLGVDALGDSAVLIKFMIKTRPLQQWSVKRELLRRIKNRFDELGIEIPFPHRSIYHRTENGADLVEVLTAAREHS